MQQAVSNQRPSASVSDGQQTARQFNRAPQVQSIEEFFDLPQPHTPDQDLAHFGDWVGEPIWVPPKDNSLELAKSMLNRFGAFASEDECWQATIRQHRSKFTQVRRFELPKASIRLPKGQLYVTVTQQKDFHTIEEEIPKSVQTRLDEFLAGPGQRRGVKVYYLKPLCVEVGNELLFTSKDEIDEAIAQIKAEVFELYRRHYIGHRAKKCTVGLFDAALSVPRLLLKGFFDRKKSEIDAVHARAEFERRKRAMKALKFRKKYRTDRCHYEDVLALTTAPKREEVIDFYVQEKNFSDLDRKLFLMASSVALPWFAALSVAAYKLALVSVTTATTVAVCDPVFVAEMPQEKGRLLKIGHFDEVDGVMHVEI